jgi:hypothetical protein
MHVLAVASLTLLTGFGAGFGIGAARDDPADLGTGGPAPVAGAPGPGPGQAGTTGNECDGVFDTASCAPPSAFSAPTGTAIDPPGIDPPSSDQPGSEQPGIDPPGTGSVGVEIGRYAGSADTTTDIFSVEGSWQLSWSVSEGGGVSVAVRDPAGELIDDVNIDPGQSSSTFAQGCTCYLEIATFGSSYDIVATDPP